MLSCFGKNAGAWNESVWEEVTLSLRRKTLAGIDLLVPSLWFLVPRAPFRSQCCLFEQLYSQFEEQKEPQQKMLRKEREDKFDSFFASRLPGVIFQSG